MGLWLKQSTTINVKIGPFIDDTDGKTAEVALTLTQADIRLSKNGANIAQKNEANNATTDELGYYDCPLDATDTGTLGVLQLFVHEAGALPVFHEYMVVPANVWDSFFGADKLDVNTAELANIDFGATMKTSLETAVDNGLDNAIPAVNTAGSVNDFLKDQIDLVLDDIHDTDLPDLHTDVGTAITNIGTVSGYVDTEVAAIKAVTDTLTLNAIADAVHDEVVEGAITLRQITRLLLAATVNKTSGGASNTLVARDLADTKPRITLTVDADGNRTASVVDGT